MTYLDHWLLDTAAQNPGNDDDGIADAGETVDLAITIRNHWGKADAVQVTLEAKVEGAAGPDPYITMITDTVNYGAVGSFNHDDNGLIVEDDVIVGVEHPFRFIVDPNTPNDHLIPILLTMTASNGLDAGDTTAYSFQSVFYLLVQRGRELPRIISEDMVLSKDYYWLLSDATLIASSATVTVTEGAQIQFFSGDPEDPLNQQRHPYLQVEGNLNVSGTAEEPVEFLTGLYFGPYPIIIQQAPGGHTEIHYARILNPVIGNSENRYNDTGGWTAVNEIDHSYFAQASNECILQWYNVYFPPGWYYCTQKPVVRADAISHSIFHKVGYLNMHWMVVDHAVTNLYDANQLMLQTDSAQSNVFLKNYVQLYDPFTGDVEYMISKAHNVGYGCNGCDDASAKTNNQFKNNAFLNWWWDANPAHWMQFQTDQGRDYAYYINGNYWGTESTALIEAAIYDFYDDFNKAKYVYQPVLTSPSESAYPFVVDVILSTALDPDASSVGAEAVTFTVTFNRDMDTAIQPAVSFGPDVPYTDFTVTGDWVDPRTWQGVFNINPITGDGYQLIRVAGAVAADDSWLVTGDDGGRFRFEIITSGTEAMNLQATGVEGRVDLTWMQDDFELLAGFNLYRSDAPDGEFARLNNNILPPSQKSFQDSNVQPGQTYSYKFTVIKTDMTESGFSNIAQGTPLDTIPPVINHTTIAEARAGLPLTFAANVTDNVAVQGVTLYYRPTGASQFSSRAMLHTTESRYSVTLEGVQVVPPGLEYYIRATDGINTTPFGRPESPYQTVVPDRPSVTAVSPNRGPASGGSNVVVSGGNLKAGATVSFGGAVCANVQVVSNSQINCTTSAHFPAAADVTVINPNSQSDTLLRGFMYEADTASLSLPDTGGEQNAIVQIPINAANVEGLAAADLTITFDSGVLAARGARTGTLTPGWNLTANTGADGEVRLSMASPGSTATGSGALALIEFDVIGSPGMTTALRLASVSLNDGAIAADMADGSFLVSAVYDVSGTVQFWNGGVTPGALLTLEGDRQYAGQSGNDGAYSVGGAAGGDYVLTPSKSDDVKGISAYDASLVLQHSAGLVILDGYPAIAADVNKSGAITSMDAYYILQKSVELITLPFPGAGLVWDFDPATRSYSGLNSNQTGQDFTAILLGDVSGNWNAGAVAVAAAAAETAPVRLLLEPGPTPATAQLQLDPGQTEVYSLDLRLIYDPAILTQLTVDTGTLARGLLLSSHASEPGLLRLALAGATPITQTETLLTLRWQPQTPGMVALPQFSWAQVNEGLAPVRLPDPSAAANALYLPVVVH